jgi:hypothetical protein
MRFVRLFVVLLGCSLFGCATFNSSEMAAIRAHGVDPVIMAKLADAKPLTPPEISALSRRGVADSFIERHLESAGVDYLVTTQDVREMRQSGVSSRVVNTLLTESNHFARRYASSSYHSYY